MADQKVLKLSDVDIVARTIYGEARGEYARVDGGISSLIAVGNVIMNRQKQQTWFGKTVREVCLKPWQFSCWNPTDPNLSLLLEPLGGKIYSRCQEVAEGVIRGSWPDLTGGCDHYHALTMKSLPKWSLNAHPKFRVGQHIFYDLRKK